MTKEIFSDHPMGRRSALKIMGAAALAGLGGLPRLSLAQAPPENRPNLIFILSDDHRWDHLSCVGHPFIQTPALDRLAREGVLFKNAFVTTSLCSPSRASFLTGTYAHTHGVKNNLTPWHNDRATFLQLVKEQGYDTAFIGKWHMPGQLPKLRGVDLFVTFIIQGGQGRYWDCPLLVNGVPTPSTQAYITTELTDRAIRYVEKNHQNPFCLVLSHKAAHHQFLPPPDLAHLYDDVELKFPEEMDPWLLLSRGNLLYGCLGTRSQLYRNYCETLVAMDREIGRLLNRLDELKLSENTMVVYAGDNGYFWGEHNLVDKRYAYEESMRIPFIVRYPRLTVDTGRTIEEMVLNVDLAPSLLDAAGLAAPASMEGRSFMPLLRQQATHWRQSWLYEYFADYPYRVPAQTAVRTDTHKYIEFQNRRLPEIYDLRVDPKEQVNLYGSPQGYRLALELKPELEALKHSFGLNSRP